MLALVALTWLVTFAILWLYGWKPLGTIELPATLCFLYIFWLLPQYSIIALDASLPLNGRVVFGFICLAVLIAIHFGWQQQLHQSSARLLRTPPTVQAPSRSRTLLVTTLSSLLTVIYLGQMAELRDVSQWSGAGTIVAFLSSFRYVALAASFQLLLSKRDWFSTSLFIITLITILPLSVLELRRSDLVFTLFTLFAVWGLVKHRLPPRWLLFAVLTGTAIFVLAISDFRAFATDRRLAEQGSPIVEPTLGLRQILESASAASLQAPDVTNAVYIISYVTQTLDLRLGAELWNDFIWQFIPAQIVGAEIKQSLLIGERVSIYSDLEEFFGYYRPTGTTRTGIGSSYLDFFVIGWVYFYLMARICAAVFVRSVLSQPHSIALFASLTPAVLISITHSHSFFFVQIPVYIAAAWLLRPSTQQPLRIDTQKMAGG